MIGRITKVRKRDGRLVDFDETRIADAIFKAACAVGREDRFLCEELAGVVTLFLEKRFTGTVPGIEEIQDMVEKVLIETGHARMAKAYILYRERRGRAREQVRVHGEGGAGPTVGNLAKARISSWSKARIRDALVREADLDESIAAKVARSVEGKVFRCGVPRITTSVIRSLVEAELFERGYGDRVGRQALIGLPKYDLDALLRGQRKTGWRPASPADLKRGVADAVLAQYALGEIYGSEVADAHVDGRLHVVDVGSPCEWLAACAAVPPAGGVDEWVETATGLLGRLAPLVTRELTLLGIVPSPCAWCGEGNGAIAAARRLLGHSALRTLDRDAGRFRVCLQLRLPDEDEEAGRLAEGIVREQWARFREGALDGLPDVVVHVAADAADGPEGRRALLPVLAAAAETGRILVVFDRGGSPALATPWFRVPAPEPPGAAAVPVNGAVAVNCSALRADREDDLLEELDRAIVLAVKALKQKRSFLGSLQADPSGPLYPVAAGARRRVAGDRGLDLVHLVGVRAAAARLMEGDAPAAARLAGKLRSYGAVRIGEEARSVRLKALAAPERDGEAAARFEALRGGEVSLDDLEPFSLPEEISFESTKAVLDPWTGRLRLRFPRDAAPPAEALFDACCVLALDPRVEGVRLEPWPDRAVRARPPRSDL